MSNSSNGYNGKFQLGDYVYVRLNGEVKRIEHDGSTETENIDNENFSGMIMGAIPLGFIQYNEQLSRTVDWNHIKDLIAKDPNCQWHNELMFIVMLRASAKYTIVFEDALTPAHKAN